MTARRLSRDMGDAAHIFKRLQFAGVPLVSLADGIDTSAKHAKLNFAVKSMLADMYLDDLRDKTLRGLEGRALAGKATGGVPFGFCTRPEVDGHGRAIGNTSANAAYETYQNAALTWNNSKNVTIGNTLTVGGDISSTGTSLRIGSWKSFGRSPFGQPAHCACMPVTMSVPSRLSASAGSTTKRSASSLQITLSCMPCMIDSPRSPRIMSDCAISVSKRPSAASFKAYGNSAAASGWYANRRTVEAR